MHYKTGDLLRLLKAPGVPSRYKASANANTTTEIICKALDYGTLSAHAKESFCTSGSWQSRNAITGGLTLRRMRLQLQTLATLLQGRCCGPCTSHAGFPLEGQHAPYGEC
jgi:hypothetical protein